MPKANSSKIVLAGVLLCILAGAILLVASTHRRGSATSSPGVTIPVVTAPGDVTTRASNDAGNTLQQPAAFSGQEGGVTGLQNAATLAPDDVNAAHL